MSIVKEKQYSENKALTNIYQKIGKEHYDEPLLRLILIILDSARSRLGSNYIRFIDYLLKKQGFSGIVDAFMNLYNLCLGNREAYSVIYGLLDFMRRLSANEELYPILWIKLHKLFYDDRSKFMKSEFGQNYRRELLNIAETIKLLTAMMYVVRYIARNKSDVEFITGFKYSDNKQPFDYIIEDIEKYDKEIIICPYTLVFTKIKFDTYQSPIRMMKEHNIYNLYLYYYVFDQNVRNEIENFAQKLVDFLEKEFGHIHNTIAFDKKVLNDPQALRELNKYLSNQAGIVMSIDMINDKIKELGEVLGKLYYKYGFFNYLITYDELDNEIDKALSVYGNAFRNDFLGLKSGNYYAVTDVFLHMINSLFTTVVDNFKSNIIFSTLLETSNINTIIRILSAGLERKLIRFLHILSRFIALLYRVNNIYSRIGSLSLGERLIDYWFIFNEKTFSSLVENLRLKQSIENRDFKELDIDEIKFYVFGKTLLIAIPIHKSESLRNLCMNAFPHIMPTSLRYIVIFIHDVFNLYDASMFASIDAHDVYDVYDYVVGEFVINKDLDLDLDSKDAVILGKIIADTCRAVTDSFLFNPKHFPSIINTVYNLRLRTCPLEITGLKQFDCEIVFSLGEDEINLHEFKKVLAGVGAFISKLIHKVPENIIVNNKELNLRRIMLFLAIAFKVAAMRCAGYDVLPQYFI